MKVKNIILIVIVLLAVLVGWRLLKNYSSSSVHTKQDEIYYCPMHPKYTSDHPGTCPICSMKLVKMSSPQMTSQPMVSQKKILYWTDPMIPGYKAGGPGKSPMGMDLIPVYEEQNMQTETALAGYASISLDAKKQQLIGIKTASVMKHPMVKTIRVYGYVAHDLELYDAQLEYIDAWRAYYAYFVRRPVKESYRPDWWKYYVTSPSEGRWHSDEKRKAQQRLVKAEYKLRHMGLNDTQLDQLRQIKYGQPWVQPDLLFFHEGHPAWVYAQIQESDLGYIDVGQKAIVTIPAYRETIEGVVRNISQMVDPHTRTIQVRVELPEYKGDLSINMFANVDMPVEMDTALVISREAVMDTGLDKIAFVSTQNGHFEPRRIQTGFESDGMVEIKSGLKEGDLIVVSGNFLLDSESRLQGSLAGGQNHD